VPSRAGRLKNQNYGERTDSGRADARTARPTGISILISVRTRAIPAGGEPNGADSCNDHHGNMGERMDANRHCKHIARQQGGEIKEVKIPNSRNISI